jgi:hypothetical protein
MARLFCPSSTRQVTETFTSASPKTWVCPPGVTNLDVASGKGAAGTPATAGSPGYSTYDTHYIHYYQRKSPPDGNGGIDKVDGGWTYGTYGTAPNNYCDPVKAETGSTVYDASQECYEFTQHNYPPTPGTAATTGASSTGFNRTFPGGTGGAASTTTFNNVPVVPNNPYPLVIPTGGTITITYTVVD